MRSLVKPRIGTSRILLVASAVPNFDTRRANRRSRAQPAPPTKTSPRREVLDHQNLREPVPRNADKQEWLAKVLASAGVASRRSCVDLVKQGQVKLNGSVITDPATKVDVASDVLEVQGKRLSVQPAAAELHYFAVNKPPGFICSNVSKIPGKRAVDLLQPWMDTWQQQHKGQLSPRLYTVGRLDVATSGLIFLTNDGDWANSVIHPSANILKEYHVSLPQPPTKQQIERLKAGTTIEGVHVAPKTVRVLQLGRSDRMAAARQEGRCVLQVEVSEGKKHEVRLLVANAGLQLLALKRVRVGGWVMPNSLPVGGYMKLKPQDLQKVFQRYQ